MLFLSFLKQTLHGTNKAPFSVRKADRQPSSNTGSLQSRCLHTTPETRQLPSNPLKTITAGILHLFSPHSSCHNLYLFMEMIRPWPLSRSRTLNFLIACHHKSTWNSNFRKNEKLFNINVWQKTRKKKKENNISEDDFCPSNRELCSQVNKKDKVQWRKAAEVSSW